MISQFHRSKFRRDDSNNSPCPRKWWNRQKKHRKKSKYRLASNDAEFDGCRKKRPRAQWNPKLRRWSHLSVKSYSERSLCFIETPILAPISIQKRKIAENARESEVFLTSTTKNLSTTHPRSMKSGIKWYSVSHRMPKVVFTVRFKRNNSKKLSLRCACRCEAAHFPQTIQSPFNATSHNFPSILYLEKIGEINKSLEGSWKVCEKYQISQKTGPRSSRINLYLDIMQAKQILTRDLNMNPDSPGKNLSSRTCLAATGTVTEPRGKIIKRNF